MSTKAPRVDEAAHTAEREGANTHAHTEEAPAAGGAGEGFHCGQCGAELHFVPGTTSLKCPYCAHVNEIEAAPATEVEEQGFGEALARLANAAAEAGDVEVRTARCEGCGSETDLPDKLDAYQCPFCGLAMVDADERARVIRPGGVLPFGIDSERAGARYRAWIGSRWFAPSDLKRYARSEGLTGVYVPYWTYDCRTVTDYTGRRGEHYWVTRRDSKGNTRRERKTRWYPAAGRVTNGFDDVLVLASTSLPRKHADRLEPWDLEKLEGFDKQYLAGFRAEKYHVGLEDGFGHARQKMEPTIRATIRRDIGGDEQQISSVDTQYHDITFKHVLLPTWISAYRYRGRVFNVLVNARTGEVQGERPYSAWKIAFAVMGGLAVIGAVVAVVMASQ